MIPVALNLASRIVSGPRAQKVMAAFFVLAAIVIVILIAVLLIRAGNDAAVKDDRQGSSLDATKIEAAAEQKAAWDHQADEITRERERANVSEAINESIRDPDGDPLAAAMRGMR